MNLKTVIIVFANSPKKELEHKPLLGGKKIFQELTKKTLCVVKSTGLPFFLFNEKKQRGDTFGERFTNAIETIFDLGFENVIIIGNDTPQLKKHHLQKSVKHLQKGKMVLGPSRDGGFYLMGLCKLQFNPNAFLKLPWQSRRLIKSVTDYTKDTNINIERLPILYDIDTLEDLKAIIKFNLNLPKTLIKILRNILGSFAVFLTFLFVPSYSTPEGSFYNKGSPVT